MDSPILVDLLFDGKVPNLTMRYSGHFEVALSDRIRVVIVNEKRLIQRGFSKEQVRAFERQYSTSVQRARIADLSKGIGIPMSTPVPIEAGPANVVSNNKGKNLALPSASLSLITESDPFSDLIAASLPKRVGNVRISYRGVDKGILIDSLLKGDYDLASIILEATIHTPKFWTAFFTKGNPFVAFGKAIDGLENVDLSDRQGEARAARLISEHGNWIGVMRERRIQVFSPRVSRVLLSPSGQPSYEQIRVQ